MKFQNVKNSWSKYGRGLDVHGTELPTTDWNCQACGELQILGGRVNFYSLSDYEFVKLCDKCFDTARHQDEKNHIKTIRQTILSMRKFSSEYDYSKEVEMLTSN